MLGILTLDTAFPRIPGDVGAPDTFSFPVRIATVKGAIVRAIMHDPQPALLPRFVMHARALAGAGCLGITTTCGFLVRWQRELAHAVNVPVLTSSLLQIPLLARTLAGGRRVGVVTYSAGDLPASVLTEAGAPADTPVVGVDPGSYFGTLVRDGGPTLDRARMAQDVIAASLRLVTQHADIGSIVLECANMPPYRDQVAEATGLPVFDAAQLIAWFYGGLTPDPPRHLRSNVW